MKKILMFLCMLTLIFGLAGSASAIPYTANADVEAQYMSGTWVKTGWFSGYWADGDTIGWTFDITDDGFDPSKQDVTSASVQLNFFSIDLLDCFFSEWAHLDVGTNSFDWEVDNGDINFTLTSLMNLSDTGTVEATLIATGGDFIFKSATLTAEGTEPVPEPATILLMGLGLFGIVGIRRRMK